MSIKLEPPHRRPGGGGSARFPVSGEVTVSLAAYGELDGCGGPTWLHAGARVVYRPFAEPDPPAPVVGSAELRAAPDARASRAYATILYGTSRDSGYAHGALALHRSIRDHGATDPFYALLGAGVDAAARFALASVGASVVDVAPAVPAGEPASALPALGVGQWAKLALWDLPVERVLYLDADALLLRNVDELFRALDGGAPVAAVDDYFTGGVLLLAPGTQGDFGATLALDAGRYVYGEQDFLNVHFAGAHVRLDAEYKCSAADAADAGRCAVLEFASCPTTAGGAWKPWHGTAMFGPDFRVCATNATDRIAALADRWARVHARALADLGAAAPPPPAAYAVASVSTLGEAT